MYLVAAATKGGGAPLGQLAIVTVFGILAMGLAPRQRSKSSPVDLRRWAQRTLGGSHPPRTAA